MSEMKFYKKKSKISSEGCQQILIRVARVLSSELKIKEERIEISTRFREDLDIDSFDEIFIVMALEKEFGIEISDEAAEKFLTVKDIVEHLGGVLRQE